MKVKELDIMTLTEASGEEEQENYKHFIEALAGIIIELHDKHRPSEAD